jgi:photosystem II stability/assembly factor-like uncharacterized protein
MKTKFLFLLLTFSIFYNAYSQSGWFLQLTLPNGAQIVDMCFLNENTGWAVGGSNLGGVIYKTTNGGTNWILIQTIPGTSFSSVSFSNSLAGHVVDAAPFGKIYRTTNGGENWTSQSIGESIKLVFFPSLDTGYITSSNSTNIYKTTNGGINWIGYLTPYSIPMKSIYFINSNTGWISCNQGLVMKTTNSGINWLGFQTQSEKELASIFFIDEQIGWTVGQQKKILKSTNGGSNWFSLNNTDTTTDNRYNSVFFITASTGWIAGLDTIFYTTNGGYNWTRQKVSIFWAGVPYRAIKFVNNNTGWVTNFYEIYKTTTGGNPIGIKKISSEIPKSFSLSQNYPNPFNPATKIKFEIKPPLTPLLSKERTGVVLKIYDILGREVATPVNEPLKPGTYEVDFDGSNLRSGVYYYKLIANEFTETKKMVLVR